MLEDAPAHLPAGLGLELRSPRPIIHTDRGGHYRGLELIEKVTTATLTRSMGRKGKSGDNAACEGFFGRMKTDMFYDRHWANAQEIESAIETYLDFYSNARIKTVLGGLTIREHRAILGRVSKYVWGLIRES